MNINRLEYELCKINQFGQSENGTNRIAYSSQEQQARKYLISLFKKEVTLVYTDTAGNIIARRMGSDPALPAVACGSHIDTVYNGGKYDGTVGVLAGLEVIRSLNDQNIKTKHSIEVIVFACEESSRFGVATIGSKAMAGLIDKKMLINLKDKDGITFEEAIRSCSLNLDTIDLSKRNKKDLKVFYELHIEQGPILENKQKQIGIVTGIAAPTRFKIEINGLAAHSGSTPMDLRQDALSGAAEIVLALETNARAEENGTVATVGDCKITPGAMNVVPGNTELKIDIRGTSIKSKEKIVQALHSVINKVEKERGLSIEVTKLSDEYPTYMDELVIDSLKKRCEDMEISYLKMPSGAGHDVMNMTALCPTGLIFIPSKDGLSHNPKEFTSLDEIEIGTRLLREEILKAACPM